MRNIVYLFVILMISCNPEKTEQAQVESSANNSLSVNTDIFGENEVITGTLEKKSFTETLVASGNIEPTPDGLVSISSPFGGFIRSIKAYIGKEIRKGDLLFTMENPVFIEMQENLIKAEAEFKKSRKDYLRQKELFEENATSRKSFEDAEAAYQSAKGKLEAIRLKIEMLQLDPVEIMKNGMVRSINYYSPSQGYISAIEGNQGKFIPAGQEIITLVNPEKLHLHLRIFEKDIPGIEPGQNIDFYAISDPEKKYSAKILSIGKTIDSENHTITLHATIDNKDKHLVPGLFVNGELNLKTDSMYAIPAEGVVLGESQNFIFIEKSGRYIKIPVQTGPEINGFYPVMNPQQNILSNPVVVKGAYYVNASIEGSGEE